MGLPVIELSRLGEETEMTESNRKAYEAFQLFQATRRFPDDPIVDWYSTLIHKVEKAHKQHSIDLSVLYIKSLVDILIDRWGNGGRK